MQLVSPKVDLFENYCWGILIVHLLLSFGRTQRFNIAINIPALVQKSMLIRNGIK